ncbi:hypothetical protein PR003_g17383 [Phytophthora rubi]|nr:hypothetical protein PR001_g16610 [Phytophthora rubi]KAE9321828.1 hypothetical protein PR003_g17383 [Phytophthora rubi]
MPSDLRATCRPIARRPTCALVLGAQDKATLLARLPAGCSTQCSRSNVAGTSDELASAGMENAPDIICGVVYDAAISTTLAQRRRWELGRTIGRRVVTRSHGSPPGYMDTPCTTGQQCPNQICDLATTRCARYQVIAVSGGQDEQDSSGADQESQ